MNDKIILNEKTVSIDPEFEYDYKRGETLYCLGVQVSEGGFLILFAKYSPNSLSIEYSVYNDGKDDVVTYTPTEEEARIITALIEDVTKKEAGMTAEQFYNLWKERLGDGSLTII